MHENGLNMVAKLRFHFKYLNRQSVTVAREWFP